MGWRINLVENNLPLSKKAVDAINALDEHLCSRAKDGALYFNRDHFEHMDYVWNDEVLAVIKEDRANGRILFSSSEGDNRGETWGYGFEDGMLTKLVRYEGNWIPQADVPEDAAVEVKKTGVAPQDLVDAKIGDSVAVGCIYAGLTSYEREMVGDILPDGTLVVEGREFSAPHYRFRGDTMSFVLKSVHDKTVDFEED